MKSRIHEKLLLKQDSLTEWYKDRLQGAYVPFYASFDVRDAGFKITNVDGNIFPAGFNNICQMDKDSAPELISQHIQEQFGPIDSILLLAEDHLKNKFYWENVIAIRDLISEAGFTVDVGMLLAELENSIELESFTGKKIQVHKVRSVDGQLVANDRPADLVVSNNDFSNEYSEIDFTQTRMTPLHALGWYQRKKHSYFANYNLIVEEFADILSEDPWLFQVQTQRFKDFEVADEASRKSLGGEVDQFLKDIQAKYTEHGVEQEPFVFVKNNSGTYGLGVVTAKSGSDVEGWNYKSKKKMKASKGGGGITEVIIQEGVPSVLQEDQATAEPVLYMLGSELAGGFLRTHNKKDAHESLNSPGAVYKRLCLSDLKVRAEGSPLENVYGWVAKVGFLAISKEAQAFKDQIK